MTQYAYGIMVGGRKRIGGTMTADSMDDAVPKIARRNGLTVHAKSTEFAQAHGIEPQTEWMFEGKRASVYVWAPPELFKHHSAD